MGGPDPYGLDDLLEVDTIPLGEQRPFVHESEDHGAVAVLYDLCRLRFDWCVQHRQRILSGVEDRAEELDDPFPRLPVDAAAHAPEIPHGSHVVLSRHDPLISCGQEGAECGSLVFQRPA